ncbi:MAG TPA: type I glutamate--ammonia ligase [Stenomitos sp.]
MTTTLSHEAQSAAITEVLSRCERDNVKFINLQFCDILGIVKSVTIPTNQFEDAIKHGKWFDGSSIEGYLRIAESDMFLLPDLKTFRVIPWDQSLDKKHARVICNVFLPDGSPFVGDPRGALQRVVAKARSLGYDFNTGPELEFFLFKNSEPGKVETLPNDLGGYFDLSTDLAMDVRADMVNALEEMGIEVETSHHEVAVGQHEIDFKYADAVSTADNAVTFRYTLKAIAQRHGLHCTFMPKPIFGTNGSGMHTHMSLFKDGENVFYDASDEYGLSQLARHFIAGVLEHAPGMIAILAPTVNSYKRLVPGYEAPVYLSWARNNRSALIRIPRINPRVPKATRVELRCPDPSCNPYLAFAVMLAAGLDGIERKLALRAPIEEDLYHMGAEERTSRNIGSLPPSLGEALEALKKDKVIQEALGDHIYERFLATKTQEWDEYRIHVSNWEVERYLELY